MKRDWIKAILKTSYMVEQNWYFGRFHRLIMWFYKIKAILCVLIGRERPHDYDKDYISVGIDNYSTLDMFGQIAADIWHEGHDWDEIAVGKGLFSGWSYETFANGDY